MLNWLLYTAGALAGGAAGLGIRWLSLRMRAEAARDAATEQGVRAAGGGDAAEAQQPAETVWQNDSRPAIGGTKPEADISVAPENPIEAARRDERDTPTPGHERLMVRDWATLGFLALAFPLILWHWGGGWQGWLRALFLAAMTGVARIDWEVQEIPDSLHLVVAALALGDVFLGSGQVGLPARCIGLVAISLPLLLIAWLTKGGMGGGDIKLMAACGLLLGFPQVLVGFILGALAAGVIALALRFAGKVGLKDQMALGPYLAMGCVLALCWGDALLGAWWGLLL